MIGFQGATRVDTHLGIEKRRSSTMKDTSPPLQSPAFRLADPFLPVIAAASRDRPQGGGRRR